MQRYIAIDGKGGKFTLGDLLGDNAKIYRY